MFDSVLSMLHIENVSWSDNHSNIWMIESSTGLVIQWGFIPLGLPSQCVTTSLCEKLVNKPIAIGRGVLICYLAMISLLLMIP